MRAQNIHVVSELEDFNNISLERAHGEYIVLINDFLILNPVALKTVYNHIYNGFFDIISVKLNQLEDALNIKQSLKKSCTAELVKYDYIDFNISNKFIKRAYLNKKRFKFTSDLKKDIKTIYEGAKYKNMDGNLLFGHGIVTSSYKKLPQSVYVFKSLEKTVKLIHIIGMYAKFFKIKTNINMYNQGYLVAVFYIISSIKERFTEIRNRF